MNKTINSFLETSANGLNKKASQPSLKVFREQLNSQGNFNTKEVSFAEMNKTTLNFKNDGKGSSL